MTLHNLGGHHRPPATPFKHLSRLAIAASITLSLGLATGAAGQEASPPASPAATPAPDAPRITIEFEELNDSGVTGEAILSEFGDRSIVQLQLEDTGENHPAHIHEGSCDDIEPEPAYPLENVGESGESTTVVDASLQDLIDGDFVIDLHLAPNQLGTLIVCAEIEGTPQVPGAGGEGTPTPSPTATATSAAASTQAATSAPTNTPTSEPTATPTEEPTATPTQEPTATPTKEPTPKPTTPTDGTGGIVATTPTDGTGADSTTSGVSDPTTTGKGLPVGGTTAGDGTSGTSNALSGKGAPVGGSTDTLPSQTGSGTSLLTPGTPESVALQATAAAALVLLGSVILIRRGESRFTTRPARFRRLGL